MGPSDSDRYSRRRSDSSLWAPPASNLLGTLELRFAAVHLVVQAELLARAGAGYIRNYFDRDFVETSNLQGQFLFDEADAAHALPKAVAAAKRLAQVNSGVVASRGDLTAGNAAELLADIGVILDGTDNFETRYLLNDFAVQRGIPWVYGAAVTVTEDERGARRDPAFDASIRSRPAAHSRPVRRPGRLLPL